MFNLFIYLKRFLFQGVYRRQKDFKTINSESLNEAKVCVMDNKRCAKKWASRFREIIHTYMICTKDVISPQSELCDVCMIFDNTLKYVDRRYY